MLLRMPRAPMQPLQLWPLAMLACRVHCRYPQGLKRRVRATSTLTPLSASNLSPELQLP